jgi:uncharacterized RmlC-like cupin family protein
MATTEKSVVLIEPPETQIARQGIPQFFGISEQSAGAAGISMNLTVFQPGGSSKAHYHREFETAIYTVSGKVALFYGEKLEHHVIMEAGSFCFIPPELPHKAYNLSGSEQAVAVTARNDPREQENVVLAPEADDGTPDRVAEELGAT